MAKYKQYSYEQHIMIPVNLHKQIMPGTFEYTLNTIIDKKFDISIFNDRYKNDKDGASAYDPRILLKIILFAYSMGIISSRKIEELCRENIVCIALAADSRPHFTTIANFISTMDKECIMLFTKILAICYAENLIGKDMFAIDGCKLSSNCSKEWSGKKSDFMRKVEKIRKSVEYLVTKHRELDNQSLPEQELKKEQKAIKKMNANVDKITSWLDEHEDKLGASGKPIQSNITDNESAKMATGHGVIQGYNGIAAVDNKHQVIVYAEAFGDINEARHLPEVLDKVEQMCEAAGIDEQIYKSGVKVTADSGYHSEEGLKQIDEKQIDAYIADKQFRQRDVRFKDVGKYKNKTADWQPEIGKKYYSPSDFTFDEERGMLQCPAGHPMWLRCANFKANRGKHTGKAYMGHVENCLACPLRSKCIRKETTKARQVVILDKGENAPETNYTAKMKEKFDTPEGRSIYSQRMGTVEPVFGHIAGTKKLNRFTLRGKKKVNIQWLLFCIMHNICKLLAFADLQYA